MLFIFHNFLYQHSIAISYSKTVQNINKKATIFKNLNETILIQLKVDFLSIYKLPLLKILEFEITLMKTKYSNC